MSQSRYSPEYKVLAREQARDAVQRLLQSDGMSNFGDVWKRLVASRGDSAADRKTFRRFYRFGPPTRPRDRSHAVLEAVAGISSNPDELRALVQEFWSVSASDPVASIDSGEIHETWFAIVPVQDGRSYTSVDHVEIRKLTLNKVTGFIRRLAPPSDSGHEWHFSGTRLGNQALFLSFWPAGTNNEFSRGTIRLLRARGARRHHYEGEYERLDESGELLTRRYTWQRTIPKSALHQVALLDLDNTLHASWSIRAWVEYLAGEGLGGADACLQQIDSALARFNDAALSHDQLATECASAYAVMLKGKRRDEIGSLAAGFAGDQDDLFAFARPLVGCLEDHLVSPVIVSGAPHEVVEHYATELGIEETFSLRLAIDENGCYTGDIDANHGLAAMKREVVNAFTAQQRKIVLAIGDSPSDRPLWQHARYRIIVGGLPPATRWPTERVMTIVPEEVSVAEIVDWVNSRLIAEREQGSSAEQDLMVTLIDQVGQAKSGGSATGSS